MPHCRADLMIELGDVCEPAKAIESFGKDRKLDSHMGWVGQRRIKGRFDPKKITEVLLQFYRKIVSLH